ncbi:MAG: hypothetical protein ACKOPE_09255 [Novosphingobium sp.]
MHNERFFEQTLRLIEQGEIQSATAMIAGKLHNAYADPIGWAETRATLHAHPLHKVLLEDPYSRRCAAKPRGYAGDAGLIDIIYDERHSEDSSFLGDRIFQQSIKFQASEGVRQRRSYAESLVADAWQAGKSICSLACGHFREGDQLIGNDLSNVTAVDQDLLSLEAVRASHGESIGLHHANVFRFLRLAAATDQKFDLIYTLGLTDYLDARSMQLLHRLMKACLAPGGTILLANFLPDHLATGWMDAVMDWQLIYRDEGELAAFAREIGMQPRCWRDPTGCIAWCRMEDQG